MRLHIKSLFTLKFKSKSTQETRVVRVVAEYGIEAIEAGLQYFDELYGKGKHEMSYVSLRRSDVIVV